MSSEQNLKLYKCLPIPKGNWRDIFEVHALRMVVIHNIIIRCYNSMLYYSGEVKAGTKGFAGFLEYCVCANHFIHHHHHSEETYWFPFLEEKVGEGCMKHNVDDHQGILTKLGVFEELVKSLQSDPSKYDVEAFRDAIHAFMPELIEHLRTEPDTFGPEVLQKHVTEADLKACEAAMHKDIMASFSLKDDMPLFWVNGDAVNSSWFPPVPGPVGFIVKYVVWYAHADVWIYGSCDRNMRVKPQFAAYEPEKAEA